MSDSVTPALPFLTADLPGCGGARRDPVDFVVEEVPAYLPCGEGEHCMARVRKAGLTTPQAVQAICDALGIPRKTAGYAGLKDKNAITTQWLSFSGTTAEALLALSLPDIEVLEAARHKNKLRVGHLRGNRFVVTLHGAHDEGLDRAGTILQHLENKGVCNFFGQQRFGRDGDNAARGLEMLRGKGRKKRISKFLEKLLLSAAQSQLFNRVLARRMAEDGLHRLWGGEVLQRTDSGGMFVSEDIEVDGQRLDRGELVITGPLYGPRMPWPADESRSQALEAEVLADEELTLDQFARFKRIARGGRRALLVPLAGAEVKQGDEPDSLVLSFTLPPGSYATVVLAEVCKTPDTPPSRSPAS